MPIERLAWVPVASWDALGALMRRVLDVLSQSDRVAVQPVTSTRAVALTYPRTLLECDATAGAVTVTFPDAATVPGFRVDAVKAAGANTLTVNGITVTTFAGWISTGAAWRRVA